MKTITIDTTNMDKHRAETLEGLAREVKRLSEIDTVEAAVAADNALYWVNAKNACMEYLVRNLNRAKESCVVVPQGWERV